MGWTASLDMGSEKMVMALASGEGSVCHLKGIKIMASQGIEHGVIKDKEKVRMCIRSLMSELMKDREIEVMNVALSGAVLRITSRKPAIRSVWHSTWEEPVMMPRFAFPSVTRRISPPAVRPPS